MQVSRLEWGSSNLITGIKSKLSDKIKDHLAQKRYIPTLDPKMVELNSHTQMLLLPMLVLHRILMRTSKQKRYELS